MFNSSTTVAFCTLTLVNILAALYAPIQDCDEVFNYWEPTHYLSHGFGLQTWEYSPEYAIRSWLYVVLHAIPGRTAGLFTWRTQSEFYAIRIMLACICSGAEARLFATISRSFNPRLAILFLIAVVTTPGLFYASVAYLPSSFAMYTSMMGLAAFLNSQDSSNTKYGIVWFGIGATIGWPFAAALILPLLLNEFNLGWVNHRVCDTAYRIIDGCLTTLIIVPIQTAVDFLFYRKFLFVPARIVFYNIFSDSSRGPDIFGIEPWHFYIRNLLLNFNSWFLLAMSCAPLVCLQLVTSGRTDTRGSLPKVISLISPFYMWLAVFSVQPHKEERFMYPMYPFLCFNAALSMHIILSYLGKSNGIPGMVSARFKLLITVVSVSMMVTVGLLRTAGSVNAYSAPLEIFRPLQEPAYASSQGNLCLGKEWYRFPSSYFLPRKMRARFIESAFDGLLPGQFHEARIGSGFPPTWTIPTGMNDQNIGDPEKLVDINQCTYLVDSHFPDVKPSTIEPAYILDTKAWETLECSKFLDVSRTHLLSRLIFVPDWKIIAPRYRRKWGEYCLLKRTTDFE